MQFKRLLVQSVFWRGLYFITVLLLNVLIARIFQAPGSGLIYYVSSFYAFFIVLAGLSLDSGMGFYASKNEVPVNKLVNLSLSWTFLVGLMVVAGTYYYAKSNRDLSFSGPILFVSSLSYICGNLLTNYCSSIFYAHRNFRSPNLIGICCNVLLVLILLIIKSGFVPVLSSTAFLYIYFLSFLLQGLLLVASLLYLYTERWQPRILSAAEFKKVIRYSLVAFTGNIIFFLVYRIDYFFVKYYSSAVDLGNYIQVSKLGQLLMLLPSIMASAVFPMVASGQKEEVKKGLKLLSRLSLLVIGTLCLLLAVSGNWFFSFIFGKSFDRMYQPFMLLVPGILSLASLYPLSAYYSGKNKLIVNIKGSFIALLFITIADRFFIPRFGINAAALISSIGYMIFHCYVLFIFKREYKTTLSDFFFIGKSDFIWVKNFILKTFMR